MSRTRLLAVVGVVMLLLVSAIGPVSAAGENLGSIGGGVTTNAIATPAGQENGDSALPGGTVSPLTGAGHDVFAGTCVYTERTDDVHYKSDTNEVSVHGWWEAHSLMLCPSKAHVTVELQVGYVKNGTEIWAGVNPGTSDIKSGTATRANSRFTCQGNAYWNWRAEVFVKLDN